MWKWVPVWRLTPMLLLLIPHYLLLKHLFSTDLSFSHSHIFTFLIVAFLTLQSPNIRHRHTVHFPFLDIIMEFLIDAVELVALAG